jgi:hypothetical protein
VIEADIRVGPSEILQSRQSPPARLIGSYLPVFILLGLDSSRAVKAFDDGAHEGGSDSVYSFFDVSGFKAGFGCQ